MPPKAHLDQDAKDYLSNLLKEERSNLLSLKSRMAKYLKQTDEVMIELAHVKHAYENLLEKWKKRK